jgi:hypothetical protein
VTSPLVPPQFRDRRIGERDARQRHAEPEHLRTVRSGSAGSDFVPLLSVYRGSCSRLTGQYAIDVWLRTADGQSAPIRQGHPGVADAVTIRRHPSSRSEHAEPPLDVAVGVSAQPAALSADLAGRGGSRLAIVVICGRLTVGRRGIPSLSSAGRNQEGGL